MKNSLNLRLLAALLIFCNVLFAQSPQGINYQSVARDAGGNVIVNQPVSVQFSIRDSSAGGSIIYQENHTVNTNAFGIFSTVIGAGSGIIGTFQGVNWGSAPKYLEVAMDFTGGTNFLPMGTSEFMSVPYSLYTNASGGDISSLSYDTTGVLNVTTPNQVITPNKGVWTTSGNGGMNSNNFIGTTDNTDMILKGHAVEGLRLGAGGAMLITGSTTSGVTPAAGPGTRMMWIPAKSAFREGTVNGNQWDNANIGLSSIAMGADDIASGSGSVVLGTNSEGLGIGSDAIGNGLISKSLYEVVVGNYNDTTGSGSPNTWVGSDPIFEIGNGTSPAARSNALTITKSGMISATGLAVKQGLAVTPTTMAVAPGTTTVPVGTQGFMIFTSNSLASLTSVTLGAGQQVGQILFTEVQATPLNGVTINNGLNLGLTNNTAMMLVWDGTNWIHLN